MDIDVRDVGSPSLIAAFGRELGIIQAINETVQCDEKHCFIDPGTHTLAMVIDICSAEARFTWWKSTMPKSMWK